MENQPVKIEMSRTEKFEVEITFPLYRKIPSGQYYYACLSKDKVVLVNTHSLEISQSYLSQAFLFKEAFDTTKEDFDAAYKTTREKLDSFFEDK